MLPKDAWKELDPRTELYDWELYKVWLCGKRSLGVPCRPVSPPSGHTCPLQTVRSIFIQRLEQYGIAVPQPLRQEVLDFDSDAWPLIHQGYQVHPDAVVDMKQPHIRDRSAFPT